MVVSEAIRERSSDIRSQREARDSLERLSFTGQSESLQCLTSIAAGDEKVHPHINTRSFEWPDDRAAKLAHRNCYEPVAKGLSPDMSSALGKSDPLLLV